MSVQIPEQFVCPDPQETAQVLLEQTWPVEHALPQLPQLWLSLLVTVQIPEQFVCPVGQDTPTTWLNVDVTEKLTPLITNVAAAVIVIVPVVRMLVVALADPLERDVAVLSWASALVKVTEPLVGVGEMFTVKMTEEPGCEGFADDVRTTVGLEISMVFAPCSVSAGSPAIPPYSMKYPILCA